MKEITLRIMRGPRDATFVDASGYSITLNDMPDFRCDNLDDLKEYVIHTLDHEFEGERE